MRFARRLRAPNCQHCVEGLCCDTACAGNCYSCALPSSPGKRSLVPAGYDPRGSCGIAAECAKTCDAAGTCVGAGPNTICASPKCTDESHGLGLARCAAANVPCDVGEQAAFDCYAYACEPAMGACYTTCSSSVQCARGYYCDTATQVCTRSAAPSSESCAIGGAGGWDGSALAFAAGAALLAVAGRGARARQRGASSRRG